jgi:hypothetical protein
MRRLSLIAILALGFAAPAVAQTATVVAAPIGVVSPSLGGTGISSYAIGDMIYASGATTLSKLSAVASGSVLCSAGVTTAPAWCSSPTVTRTFTGDGLVGTPARSYSGETGLGAYRIGSHNEGFASNSVAAFDYSDTRVNFTLPVLFTGSSKNITWNTDGGGNIGTVGANRPDNGYFKTGLFAPTGTFATSVASPSYRLANNSTEIINSTGSLTIPSGQNITTNGGSSPTAFSGGITVTGGNNAFSGALTFNSRFEIRAGSADGIGILYNSGETGFSLLQFGGTTTSFPALKRSSALIQARLADDSDFAELEASYFGARSTGGFYFLTSSVQWTSGSGSPEGVVTAPVGSIYSRTNGGAATSFYVKESGSGNTGWVAK